MKNKLLNLIKKNMKKYYFEIEESEDNLIFILKNGIPLVKKYLIVKNRDTGKRIKIPIKNSKAILNSKQLSEIGELGVYDIYLLVRFSNKAFFKRTAFNIENRSKTLIDFKNNRIFESYPTIHSSLSFNYKEGLFKAKSTSISKKNDSVILKGKIELNSNTNFDEIEILAYTNKNRQTFPCKYEKLGNSINFESEIKVNIDEELINSHWNLSIRLKKDDLILFGDFIKAGELSPFNKKEQKFPALINNNGISVLYYVNKKYDLKFRIEKYEKAKAIVSDAHNKDIYNSLITKKNINNNLIFFESFHGKYTNNPKYIYEEMLNLGMDKKYQFVWSYDETNGECEIPGNPIIVEPKSENYYRYLAEAKYWINNATFPQEIKRKDCIYLQTWHGTPLKKLGSDIINNKPGVSWNHFNIESKNWDYLISANKYSTKTFKRAFNFKKEILEVGYPANDVFFNKDEKFVNSLKEKLNIPKDKKVIFYAPTFRDSSKDYEGNREFKIILDLEDFYKNLKNEYILIIKTHSVISKELEIDKNLTDFIFDLSSYDDIHELYLISDILITDYSSVFFDFANSKKPILFFAPDMEYYANERGIYPEVIEDLPGPIFTENYEVIDAIKNLDIINEKYNEKYNAFYNKYCYLENGKSAKKAIMKVFK